jgi:tight adherence protein B
MLIPAVVFVVTLTAVYGAYWAFVLRPEEQEERALRRRLKTRRPMGLATTVVKASESLSALGPLNAALSRWHDAIEPLHQLMDRAGLKVTIGTVILTCVFLASVAFALVLRLSSSGLIALTAAVPVGFLPIVYIRHAARKRLVAFEEQFPEAMDLMARALRAGHALTTALQIVGDEVPDPVGAEFKLLFDRQNYGMSLPDALRAFADRMPILDARFFVTALLTQREMGGNLSEVLDNLATVIRERFKVKRQVRIISAHGRITGVVLGFLPPVVALILLMTAPEHIRLLVDDPLGLDMLIGAVILQCVGVVIIRRIVRVEY